VIRVVFLYLIEYSINYYQTIIIMMMILKNQTNKHNQSEDRLELLSQEEGEDEVEDDDDDDEDEIFNAIPRKANGKSRSNVIKLSTLNEGLIDLY
jgi:hypothetical protein